MSVTQKEIVGALNDAHYNADWLGLDALANRIEREGIAPPDGYAIVPIEPTDAMVLAAWKTTDENDPNNFCFTEGYKAMLTAAKGIQ